MTVRGVYVCTLVHPCVCVCTGTYTQVGGGVGSGVCRDRREESSGSVDPRPRRDQSLYLRRGPGVDHCKYLENVVTGLYRGWRQVSPVQPEPSEPVVGDLDPVARRPKEVENGLLFVQERLRSRIFPSVSYSPADSVRVLTPSGGSSGLRNVGSKTL